MSLNEADRYVLVSALDDVVRLAPRLDDLMVPRQPSAGEQAGIAPRPACSKLPLVAHPLDVKVELERVVFGWCGSLHDVTGEQPPTRQLVPRGRWLRERVEVIEAAEWAGDFLAELVEVVRPLRDLVDPPEPVQSGPGGEPAREEWGSVDDVVDALAVDGVLVSRAAVYRWAQAGEVRTLLDPRGRQLVHAGEVASVVERRRAS